MYCTGESRGRSICPPVFLKKLSDSPLQHQTRHQSTKRWLLAGNKYLQFPEKHTQTTAQLHCAKLIGANCPLIPHQIAVLYLLWYRLCIM